MEVFAPILQLRRLAPDVFRGGGPDDGAPRLFGGQVIAQSLLAAYETVSEQVCHSLHAYFLHPGDPRLAITYQVERMRDGGSFATRRVTAMQAGRQIFNLAASFQTACAGLEHQAPAPAAPGPDEFVDDTEREALAMETPEARALLRRRLQRQVIEMRSLDPTPAGRDPRQQLWIRSAHPIGGEPRLQHVVLAYASDLALLATSLRAHQLIYSTPGLQTVSLDHAIWFHRPTDFHAWHLYDMESVSTSGGRGLNRGAIYARDGVLVATVVQESLLRMAPLQAGERDAEAADG